MMARVRQYAVRRLLLRLVFSHSQPNSLLLANLLEQAPAIVQRIDHEQQNDRDEPSQGCVVRFPHERPRHPQAKSIGNQGGGEPPHARHAAPAWIVIAGPYSMSVAIDGHDYVTANQLPLQARYNNGRTSATSPKPSAASRSTTSWSGAVNPDRASKCGRIGVVDHRRSM